MTSNKPKSPQSVPSERDIQNGESQHSSVTPTSGRFHDENGLKRCILCNTNLSSSQKVSEVPVRKGDLRVPVPSLWPGVSSKGIYQTPETYCCSDSGQGHTDAMSEDIQPSHQSVIQPGISDQTREICSSCPTQQITFLGALLNTISMTIALPEEKMELIVQTSHQMYSTHQCSLQELSTLLGRMSHAAQTGIWTAPLHYRMLQGIHIEEIQRWGFKSKKHILQLQDSALKDLGWWIVLELVQFNQQAIQLPPFDLSIRRMPL